MNNVFETIWDKGQHLVNIKMVKQVCQQHLFLLSMFKFTGDRWAGREEPEWAPGQDCHWHTCRGTATCLWALTCSHSGINSVAPLLDVLSSSASTTVRGALCSNWWSPGRFQTCCKCDHLMFLLIGNWKKQFCFGLLKFVWILKCFDWQISKSSKTNTGFQVRWISSLTDLNCFICKRNSKKQKKRNSLYLEWIFHKPVESC